MRNGKEAGIMQDKSYDGIGGPQITADAINAQYTVETVVMAVLAAAIFALLVGFITGYFCGRRCHKDEDDNLPYPDTEYEYFEQRSNINRWVWRSIKRLPSWKHLKRNTSRLEMLWGTRRWISPQTLTTSEVEKFTDTQCVLKPVDYEEG